MTRLSVLLLLGGMLLAQDGSEALRIYSDEEIQRHLDTFDKSCDDRALPEADVVDTLNELEAAYQYLRAKGERLTNEESKLREEIVARAVKGLAAKRRPIVNIHSANVLGSMGDPKGWAPLVAWVQGLLKEAHPNPQAVQSGLRSLAWIGPSDKTALDLTLGCATGTHDDEGVVAAGLEAAYEWRALDGETRKRFFDGICAYLENLLAARDADSRNRYEAVRKEGLQALRELAGGKTRFDNPSQARAWFEKNTTWEPYAGPRFRP